MIFVESLFHPLGINTGAVNAASQDAVAGGQLVANQAQQREDWAKGMSDQVLASAKEASGRDFTLADTANAADMWNRYRKTYKPVEDQTVKDAAGYDSQNWTKIGMGAAG